MPRFALLASLAALTLIAANAPAASPDEPAMTVTVDCARTVAPLEMFWNAAGNTHSPRLRQYTVPVFQANLYLIGSAPHQGCLYQRSHNLLNYIAADGMETDNPRYDWSRFDFILDAMVHGGLRPWFELMGKPSPYFTDFHDDRQLAAWRRLVRDVAQHCIDRYGRQTVRSWFFETWNEPDLNDGWDWDAEELMRYYDACAAGLADADEELRLGGLGTAENFHPWIRRLVEHCAADKSAPEGKPPRLDFVSYHFKTDAASQTDKALEVYNWLKANHPSMADIRIVNNEADSESGWRRLIEFRARPFHAAYIGRQVVYAQMRLRGPLGVDYHLANDNSGLGEWTQRSQLAWLGDAERFVLIKKPAHNATTLLSLLGDRQLQADPSDPKDELTVLATRRDGQVAILVVNGGHLERGQTGPAGKVRLKLSNLPFPQARVAHYRIDARHGDTYQLWLDLGSPEAPSAEQLDKLRAGHELTVMGPVATLEGRSAEFDLDLPNPAMHLVLLTAKPADPPAKVTGLFAQRYVGLVDGSEDVLLRWTSGDRLVRTYEVLYAGDPNGPFERVNAGDLLCSGFVHRVPAGSRGWYKVRAVDYWDVAGPESQATEPVPPPAPLGP